MEKTPDEIREELARYYCYESCVSGVDTRIIIEINTICGNFMVGEDDWRWA